LPTFATIMDVVSAIAKKTGHPVLILVDEVHSLYSAIGIPPGIPHPALVDLLLLGGERNGRAVTVICGSASVTRALCFCKLSYDSDVVNAYPCYQLGKSLNHTKFRDMTIPRLSRVVVDATVRTEFCGVTPAMTCLKRFTCTGIPEYYFCI
jgi:hypothetical protein